MNGIGARVCVRAGIALTAVLFASSASADLTISKQPSKNVSCSAGACVATAKHAVLNVADLSNMLATQSAVSLDAGPAKDITVNAPLSWASSTPFTLKASGVLSVKRKMTAAGHATVNIQSNGLTFAPHASLTFWDKTSSLTINSHLYTLVTDPESLWWSVEGGDKFTALANDYDALNQAIHTIDRSPGVVEGLGHTIANVAGGALIKLNSGRISNIHLKNWRSGDGSNCAGILVDENDGGSIDHASATGSVSLGHDSGGLVGCNWYSTAVISYSYANAKVSGQVAGGLVGFNSGTIESSYAEGVVEEVIGLGNGGLVGQQYGHINNSYSLANVRVTGQPSYPPSSGGLVGYVAGPSTVTNAYAAGKIRHPAQRDAMVGGIIGTDGPKITFSNVYWDFTNGVTDPGQGAGNVPNAPGLTGLTDAQLKSGLPGGFDPKIWGSDPNINGGYPYLRANPPQ